MNLSEVLLALNIMIAIGTILSGVVSWAKGGFVRRLFDSVKKIDDIEGDVNEINTWKDDIEVLLVSVAKGAEGTDEEAVMEELDLALGYKEYMVKNSEKEEDRINKGD